MIDPEVAWELVRKHAEKAITANVKWSSLTHHHEYTIINIMQNQLTIQRQTPHHEDVLTSREVLNGIVRFNAANCYIRRGYINPIVAKETALVFLHPNLTWIKEDDNAFFIVQV